MEPRAIAPLTAAALLCAQLAAAQNSPLHVFASNGVKAVIDDVKPNLERAAGRTVNIEFGTTSGLKQKIDGGESFDVAILTADAVEDLVKTGKISAATPVARCGIGVGVRAGAPKPDISNPEALKRTLLNAKAITYAQDGASRAHIEKMVERFGITKELQPKTMLVAGSVRSNALVADGKAEIVMTLVSEILPAPGVQLVGPLPKDVQSYVSFATGISPASKSSDAGRALIKFLTSPAVAPVLKTKGMER